MDSDGCKARQFAAKLPQRSFGAAMAEADGAPMYDLIELMFFAYRDFVGDADHLLAALGFGRAHHRVLHFVSRRPGLTIAELLGHFENHQAESESRAQGTARPGLCRSPPGRARTVASANCFRRRAARRSRSRSRIVQSKRFAAVFAKLPEGDTAAGDRISSRDGRCRARGTRLPR